MLYYCLYNSFKSITSVHRLINSQDTALHDTYILFSSSKNTFVNQNKTGIEKLNSTHIEKNKLQKRIIWSKAATNLINSTTHLYKCYLAKLCMQIAFLVYMQGHYFACTVVWYHSLWMIFVCSLAQSHVYKYYSFISTLIPNVIIFPILCGFLNLIRPFCSAKCIHPIVFIAFT